MDEMDDQVGEFEDTDLRLDNDVNGDLEVETIERNAEVNEGLNDLVGEEVIDFMAGLLERIRSSSGRSLVDLIRLQSKWYDDANPHSPPVVLSYDQSRSVTDASELSRAMNMRRLLTSSNLVLRQLSDCVEHQLKACENQIAALNIRAAFSSLPDEILSSVLEYAAYRPEVENTRFGRGEKARSIIDSVQAAVKLSSVCSRFRGIAIHSPVLWNRICVGMPHEMLLTCVNRVGTTGLHVFFDITLLFPTPHHTEPREALIRPFLDFVIPFANIWRRFDYHCFPCLHDNAPFPEAEMANLEAVTNSLRAPHLSELVIRYEPGETDNFYEIDPVPPPFGWKKTLHYYSTWTLPCLRVMSTTNLIPIPFSGCTSIETLSIDMDYSEQPHQMSPRPFDVIGLSEFLSSCTVLKKLNLRLTHATALTDEQATERVVITNVEELHLYLDWCSSRSVEYFFDAVHFPCVKAMKFKVICNEDVEDVDRYANSNVQAVFSKPGLFPLLERLIFTTRCNFEPWSRVEPSPTRSIYLPIHNMPSLNYLRLQFRAVVLEPVVDGDAIPPRLSSLSIGDCEISVWFWIAELARLFKAHGRKGPLQIFSKNGLPDVSELPSRMVSLHNAITNL